MRKFFVLLVGTTVCVPGAANAVQELRYGKPPAWVAQQPIPAASRSSAEAPVAMLLMDQQVQFQPGKVVTYAELAMKLQKPDGLAAGNLSLPWNPANDTVTVNKLEIHRGDNVIDVLASGQKFVTMRRESGLEAAMLDGYLTANIQPEGLQEGDVIVLATTVEHTNPVLGQHVESNFAVWPEMPIGRGHVSIRWPDTMKVTLRSKGVTARPTTGGGYKYVEVTETDIQPIVAPKGAPTRFNIQRFGEATDFNSWSDVARLMAPLYRKAATLPASGPLHDEVEKIRASVTDPKARTEKALQLVQQRVRYVALSMDQGALVPTDAEATWSRRFGDCKAKTALLLAILHAFDIEAEPILVQSKMGDAIGERLPMVSYFDHVLVRARVGGRTYYLDGTRTGDTLLDQIRTPDFGWALPVVENANLVQLVPAALDRPESETSVVIDARSGIYAPAAVTGRQVVRGDYAVSMNSGLVSLTEAQRREFFQTYWKKIVDDVQPGGSTFTFDKASRELQLSMQGKLPLDWTGGFYHMPLSSVGYEPDLDRAPGPGDDAPVAVSHPLFASTETKLLLPPDFFPANVADLTPGAVNTRLIGIEYSRIQRADRASMTVTTTSRSLVPEVSYKQALADRGKLKALAGEEVSIRLPASYRATAADLPALKNSDAANGSQLVTVGNTLMQSGQFDEAIAKFNKALELNSRDALALADRAVAYAWTRKFDHSKKDAEAALAIEPTSAVAFRARALAAEFSGNCAAAVEAYTASLRSEPQNSFAIGHRALCQANLSKNDEALADSALALKAMPAWIDLRLLRANIFVTLGKNDEVANEARLLMAENPKSAYAFVGAGRIYARLRRTDEAMKAFDTALALEPQAYVYVNRAQARPFGDRKGRLADLDTALKLEPQNEDALAEKAEELAASGDLPGARRLYDQLIKVKPKSDFYTARQAVLLFKLGETAQATKIFADIRSKATSAREYNNLCWAKATAGILLDSALEDCREALRRQPDAAAYLDSLALVELRRGDIDAAIASYSRAIAKNSGSSYMGRAIAHSRKGDQKHAAADLVLALQRDPDAQNRFAEYGLQLGQPAKN